MDATIGKKRKDAFATNYKSVRVKVCLWAQNKNPRELSLSLLPSKANSRECVESFQLYSERVLGVSSAF